jgi:hypothetical protein
MKPNVKSLAGRRGSQKLKRDRIFHNKPAHLNKPIPIISRKIKRLTVLWLRMQGGDAA